MSRQYHSAWFDHSNSVGRMLNYDALQCTVVFCLLHFSQIITYFFITFFSFKHLESAFFPSVEKLSFKRYQRTTIIVLYVCCVFGIVFGKIMKIEARDIERFWKFLFFVVRELSIIGMFSGSAICFACSLCSTAVSAVLQSTPKRYTGNSPRRFLNSVV